MLKLGMHTDNWRTLSGSLEQAVAAAQNLELAYIEFGVVDGQDFIQGLGYAPTVSLDANPIRLRRYLDEQGLQVSQIDAGYPISGPLGASFGVRYAQRAIQFAKAIGCPCVDTTDGQFKPDGYSDEETIAITIQNYRQILEWAEDYEITVNIEPHGPFTTNPDVLARIFDHFDSPWLGLNFDTGNTFIAGQDPPAFLERFLPRLKHLHIKDVSADMAADATDDSTGIAMSESPIGSGINAENISKCLQLMKAADWDGVLSIECLGTEQILASSTAWLRRQIAAEID
ncbi:MAG: sugar phosphate isomerase/epimerase family protein [Planctomycetota bacterium]|jgi:sugar phosphate isomerase/epimerase|nr:sugar phosphate isomerase/epimerase family protein [Planctomycetota bacterium]